MFLRPDSRPFGVAPEILVNCAKHLTRYNGGFQEEAFFEVIGAPAREAGPVLREMIAAGYIEVRPPPYPLVGTRELERLSRAPITYGLRRENAQRLLQRVIFKAAEINAHPDEYRRGVVCLVVFGSFLSEAPVLGNINIGVQLFDEPTAVVGSRANVPRILKRSVSPTKSTLAALSIGRPKLISLHPMEEVFTLQARYKVVFGRVPTYC